MNAEGLFQLLVRYHVEHNLPRFVDSIEEGVSSLVHDDDIGYDDAVPRGVKRFLIIANGDTLATRLRQTGVILEKQDPEFEDVKDADALYRFFNRMKGDGAYILNKERGKIARVHHLKNDPPGAGGLDYLLDLPLEFLTYDKRLKAEEVGCKTRLAATLPHVYQDVDAYQIKATVHSPLGLGIVSHFGKGYLETFHFEHVSEPDQDTPMIVPEKNITGVYRRYSITEKGYKLQQEEYMVPMQAVSTG